MIKARVKESTTTKELKSMFVDSELEDKIRNTFFSGVVGISGASNKEKYVFKYSDSRLGDESFIFWLPLDWLEIIMNDDINTKINGEDYRGSKKWVSL